MLETEHLSGPVWRLTLVSEADRNALGASMREAIMAAVDQILAGGGSVVIVRGSGGVFSSGYKLDPGVMRPTSVVEDRARLAAVADFHRRFRELPLITIAQIEGHCVAGGTDFMLAHDLAIASDDASLAVPNVRAVGITLLLPLWSWMVGPQRAKLLALTGDAVRGDEAARMGLIAASLPADVLGDRVLELAERIALMPRDMLDVVKQSLNMPWDNAGLAPTLMRAAELDALSHATEPVIRFWDDVEAQGVRQAVRNRDAGYSGKRLLEILAGDGQAAGIL